MSDDAELVSAYARDRSEAAFSELIRRHMDLVYTAALRLTGGDAHCAQDVTQLVFIELARQAGRLKNHPALVGWLYTTTRYTALRLARTEHRRQTREQEAQSMNELLTPSDLSWEELHPVLDEAMDELPETDRLAVLLRFFKKKSLNEVGRALGLTENGARMRVDRALDKLRRQLVRKGVTSTSAALALVLSAKAVADPPAGLAATVLTASLAAAGTGTAITLLNIAVMTKLKVILTTLVVAGAATTIVIQHQTEAQLGQENESLRQQLVQLQTDNAGLSDRLARLKKAAQPRLPAPRIQAVSQSPGSTEEMPSNSLYARFGNEPPKLTAAQIERYLKANGRKASSLLAAYRTSGDKGLLNEAMQKFPNDPQVAFEAVLNKDLSAEQRRDWLNTFKQNAPNNALADYLSARDYFNSGQLDQAVQELTAASGKRQFTDYTLDRMQDDEEAYLASGYSAAESKLIGSSQVELPHLAELKKLGQQIIDLSNSYRQAGDVASAQAVLEMTIMLGQAYGSGDCMISHLVGMAIERNALGAMDPNSPFGDSGQTVQDRLAELSQRKDSLKALASQSQLLLQNMSDQDWISYVDRVKSSGEEAALQWVIGKHGGK